MTEGVLDPVGELGPAREVLAPPAVPQSEVDAAGSVGAPRSFWGAHVADVLAICGLLLAGWKYASGVRSAVDISL